MSRDPETLRPEPMGSQAQIAAYLTAAAESIRYSLLGRTDLERLALALARPYSSTSPLTRTKQAAALSTLAALAARAADLANADLDKPGTEGSPLQHLSPDKET